MKVVIDTNVLFAALYSKNGASHKLLVWLFTTEAKHSVVSTTLVLEYEDVLTREQNRRHYPHLHREEIVRFIDDFCLISHQQQIYFLWRPFLKDATDDMVLEVAVNAGAQAIITFNPKDFTGVKEAFGIDILTPKTFLIHQGVIA